jgi:SNF2 family DNA or RNA helicase
MELFDYQKEAIGFIGKAKRAYLALDMGMGKTLTALSAGESFGRKNVLVIAEKNEIVNSENFRKEVESFFQESFQYHSLRDKETPPLAQYSPRYVCGINPDGLVKQDIEFLKKCFDTVIIDEATMAKTTTTARFKMVRKVCAEMEYIVLLSGTPMMNGAAELYAPLLLLGHPLAGDGSRAAREAFETIFAGGHRRKIRNTGLWFQDYTWWAKGANHVRELRYLISDKFFFKRKADSNIFKKKVRVIERVPMTVEWIVEYRQAWEDYLEKAKKRDVDLDNVMELQKLIENGQLYQVNSKWKAKRVVDDIAEGKYGDQRIVVFSMFIETDNLVQRYLDQAGIKYKTFETPNGVQDFKAGDGQVLVGRIKAHGKGGNLPEASVCLFVDMDFVPANNVQAENRIDRPEQTRDMTIVYYMTEGDDIIDAHVRAINQDKTRKIDEFMRPLTDEEIMFMPGALDTLYEKYRKHFITLGYEEGLRR